MFVEGSNRDGSDAGLSNFCTAHRQKHFRETCWTTASSDLQRRQVLRVETLRNLICSGNELDFTASAALLRHPRDVANRPIAAKRSVDQLAILN